MLYCVLAVAILVLCVSVQLVYIVYVIVSLISFSKFTVSLTFSCFQRVTFAKFVFKKLTNINFFNVGIVVLFIALLGFMPFPYALYVGHLP